MLTRVTSTMDAGRLVGSLGPAACWAGVRSARANARRRAQRARRGESPEFHMIPIITLPSPAAHPVPSASGDSTVDLRAGRRLVEADAVRVQEIAAERRLPSTWPARRTDVSPTTGWPMLARCTRIWCVRPVPMRTSSSVKSGERRSTRYSRPGRAALRQPRRHARAAHRIARDRAARCARSSFLHRAVHQREVDLLHLAPGELRRQRLVRGVVLGHQQHAAGEAVQPVHDARPQVAAHAARATRSGAAARSPACPNARPRRRGPPCRRAYRWPPGRHLRRGCAAGSSSAVACSGGGSAGSTSMASPRAQRVGALDRPRRSPAHGRP